MDQRLSARITIITIIIIKNINYLKATLVDRQQIDCSKVHPLIWCSLICYTCIAYNYNYTQNHPTKKVFMAIQPEFNTKNGNNN